MEIINSELVNSLRTSFLDKENISTESYHTKLLFNDYNRGVKVLRTIQHELDKCTEFLFSVAFITESGLNVLANQLRETNERGVKGKILTSSYLLFNQPKMFRKLMKYPNIEVKIYEKQPLHAKGYIFRKENETTFVVGSSNLTDSALCTNKEWNLKLTSLNEGQIIEQSMAEFNYIWNQAIPLTEEWVQNYEISYLDYERIKESRTAKEISRDIIPNTMQVEALKNLEALREAGESKALLISSTGTGKTYLSAFDVKNFKAKKMLFVIHREQIARDALNTFRNVIKDRTFGMYSGNSYELEADYIFTTVQTMSKQNNLNKFKKDHFDYIVIDEAHRSAAGTYQTIINHFEPKFLLGMTATPERSDDNNIYENFDYNIAYEIRLKQAMEENMLCPFHYFGVSELLVNDELINDSTRFNDLVSEARVDHILEQVSYYGYSGERVKGLIFCSRNDEAEELSKLLNQRGYLTRSLSGSNTQDEREEAINALVGQERELDYIITVDIFNEGIDIPEINQIVMLRPTQSSIIFVQQLGRGLRRNKNKEYVNIIDFIGNYKNNFLIPIALSGDKSFDKDSIKEFMIEGNSTLPGTSTINFDKITRDNIYESINTTKFSSMKNLRIQYQNLKFRLGRIPNLIDFMINDSVDPKLIFDLNGMSNYYNFLKKADKDYVGKLTEDEDIFLSLVSQEMVSGKRDTELIVLRQLLECNETSFDSVSDYLIKEGDFDQVIRLLDLSFFTSTTRNKFKNKKFVTNIDGVVSFSNDFIRSEEFNDQLHQLIELGLFKYEHRYKNRSKISGMLINERYGRKDMCKYFNWHSDMTSTVYGYLSKFNTFPIFVTYHKSNEISESTNYNDQFINNASFSWMTKSRRTLNSKEVKLLQEHKKNDLQISLFIKREDAENDGFYYLGEMEPLSFDQTTIGIETPQDIVNVTFKLKNPVREDIYHFLTES